MPPKYNNNPPPAAGFLSGKNLANVQLPPKIKCVRCNKFKSESAYSQKQIKDMKQQVHRFGMANARLTPKCLPCTGGPPTEMKCVFCNQDKELEAFGKAQRSNPDSAKCRECMKEQTEYEPEFPHLLAKPREDVFDNTEWSYEGSVTADYESVTASSNTDRDTDVSFSTEITRPGRPVSARTGIDAKTNTGGVSLVGSTFQNESALGASGWAFDEESDATPRAAKTRGTSSSNALANPSSGWTTVQSSNKAPASGWHPNKYGNPASRASSVAGDTASHGSPASITKSRERFPKVRPVRPGHYLEELGLTSSAAEAPDSAWHSDDDEAYGPDDDSDDE